MVAAAVTPDCRDDVELFSFNVVVDSADEDADDTAAVVATAADNVTIL